MIETMTSSLPERPNALVEHVLSVARDALEAMSRIITEGFRQISETISQCVDALRAMECALKSTPGHPSWLDGITNARIAMDARNISTMSIRCRAAGKTWNATSFPRARRAI